MGLHLDQMAVASLNPATPRDERWDINSYLFSQFRDTIGDRDLMDQTQEQVAQLLVQQHQMQAGGGGVVPAGVLAKAAMRLDAWTVPWSGEVRDAWGDGHQAILAVDEFGVVQQGSGGAPSRWVEKPVAGGFDFLRSIVDAVDFIKAVILTRQRQIVNLCKPATKSDPLGFVWVRKDGQKLTDADVKETQALTQWILRCGDQDDARKNKRLRRPEMQEFVSKLLWDTLSADACPIETELSRSGKKIVGLYNVPYDTVRLCTEQGYEGDDEFFAVQVINGSPYLAFGYDDLIYEVRNPRTDLHVNGYGYAEPEMVLRVLTAYMNSFTFNAAALDRNSIPRGVMAVTGEYDRREMNAFRNNLRAMLHGAGSRWTLPVWFSKNEKADLKYVKMDDFNEMFFAKWFTLLVSIICAIYSIDPRVVNFDSFNSQNTSPLGGNDTEEKLKADRDKGLIPLLGFVGRVYNRFIVPRLTSKYEIAFTGLHNEDPQIKQKKIELVSTVDELRDSEGKPPHQSKLIGGAPLNQAHMQLYMMDPETQKLMGAGQPGMMPGGDENEDYPQNADGEHAPYGDDEDGGEPDGDHFHTLRMFGGGADKGAADRSMSGGSSPKKKAAGAGAFAKAVPLERRVRVADRSPTPRRPAAFNVRLLQ